MPVARRHTSKSTERPRDAPTAVVAFADLGMEAIHEFEVTDMPVTVAVDSAGDSVHETGPRERRQRIAGIPVIGA